MITQSTSRNAKQPDLPEPKRGTRQAQASIRREQVLAAALKLFCEQGYAGTSTKRIAQAAGVAEGLVFHYFSSKEQLLLELAARQHTFAGRVLTLIQSGAGSPVREVLRSVAAGLCEVTREERAFIAFLQAEVQINPAFRSQLRGADTVVMNGFFSMLEHGKSTEELRADAPLESAAQGFFGGFMFFMQQHRDSSDASWRKLAQRFAESWADVCWRGIASDASLKNHSTTRTDFPVFSTKRNERHR